jgi:hypothetical protein
MKKLIAITFILLLGAGFRAKADEYGQDDTDGT